MYVSTTKIFKLSPWVDLDLFYAKVIFGYIGFYWAKVKIMYYLETIAAIGLKVGLNVQINELMKLNEYQSQGHYLTFVKGHSDFKILVFLRYY